MSGNTSDIRVLLISRHPPGNTAIQRDRRFDTHLNTFYDKVISSLREIDSVLILGPGEAKGELQKRLEGQGLGERVAGIEAADKMSEGQIIY